MRLYYHPLSSNSRRVLLTAVQLGMPLRACRGRPRQRRAQDLALPSDQSERKGPLAGHDGFHLWESHAIMQYLADACNGEMLYPHDIQARADINRWLFWSAYHYTPAVGLISRERVSKSMVGGSGGPDPAEIARGEALLTAAADVLDRHLARQAVDRAGQADARRSRHRSTSDAYRCSRASGHGIQTPAGLVCAGDGARRMAEDDAGAIGLLAKPGCCCISALDFLTAKRA